MTIKLTVKELVEQLQRNARKNGGMTLEVSKSNLRGGVEYGVDLTALGVLELEISKDEPMTVPYFIGEWLDERSSLYSLLSSFMETDDIRRDLWIRDNRQLEEPGTDFLARLWRDGWETEERPKYVVSYYSPILNGTAYFIEFSEDMRDTYEFGQSGSLGKNSSETHVFTDHEEAEAVATLVGGSVVVL